MNGGRSSLKRTLEALYEAALSGVDPASAVARALSQPTLERAIGKARRLGVFASGKAATGMLAGLGSLTFERGLAVLPRGYAAPRAGNVAVLTASHPRPDRSSLEAADEALAFFSSFGPADCLLCLISGGSSALLCKPRPGLRFAAKRAAIDHLAATGASILQLNRLRRRLSGIKAGKLGRATKARLITLVVSDVEGDDPRWVGSGPTIRGHAGDIVRVIATNRSGLSAAGREAARRRLAIRSWRRRLRGEAAQEARLFARAAMHLSPGQVLTAGGETTVVLSRRHGRGGRNLEFALSAAGEIAGERGLALLAAGSDGIDGSSCATGAFVDGTTIARCLRLGQSPDAALRRHDTESIFERLEDLWVTGPTGTNVGDWVFAVRRSR